MRSDRMITGARRASLRGDPAAPGGRTRARTRPPVAPIANRRVPAFGALATAAAVVALTATATAMPARREGGGGLRADRPGSLVIAAARDTAAGFRWLRDPERSRQLLVWPDGLLALPDDLAGAAVDTADLAFSYAAGLRGFSGGRLLAFVPGHYAIDAPILLDDGRIQLFAAAGSLAIGADRIRYTRAAASRPARAQRGQYLILAAIIMLSLLLLRRARSRMRKRRGP